MFGSKNGLCMWFAISPCWPSHPFVTRGYIKVFAATGEDTVGSVQGYIDLSAAMVEIIIGSVRCNYYGNSHSGDKRENGKSTVFSAAATAKPLMTDLRAVICCILFASSRKYAQKLIVHYSVHSGRFASNLGCPR